MLKNYFTIAYRLLFRNKIFSFINIFGLSIALTSVLIIFLFIGHELSFDKYHTNFKHIYKVVSKEVTDNGERYEESVTVMLSSALRTELTGYNHITQVFFNGEQLFRVNENKYIQEGVLYADTNFVNVFDVDFLYGNPSQLKDPNVIFLTESIAKKYFGSPDKAINKEIVMLDSISLNVAGVIKDPPKNTHMPYQVILSWKSMTSALTSFDYENWGTNISGFATYLTLKEGISESDIMNQMEQVVAKNNPNYDPTVHYNYILEPLKKIHLDDRFDPYSGAYVTSKKFIWIFISVALFILTIAFINFTNLSIVQTIKRVKEVGIRKVLGAGRKMLIKQFLGETFLLLILAEILSLILSEVVLGKINLILGNNIELKVYSNLSVIVFLVLVLISLTFLSGFYPAVILSRYNPVRALRYKMKIGKKSSFSLHNFLVIFQFFISQILIVSAIIIALQIDYFKNKDLGFDKENIILVDIPQNQTGKAKVLAGILKQNPDIKNVSLGIGAPMAGSNINTSFEVPGDPENNYHANVKTVDSTYYKLYKLRLIAGGWYSTLNNDTLIDVVVNKTLVQKMGIDKPVDAIDKVIKVFGSLNARIMGVVEDFHIYPLQYNIHPVIFMPLEDFYYQLSIKTSKQPYSKLKPIIEKSWDEVFPEYIYQYKILEDTIKETYKSEQRVFDIVSIFTFIAIIIACLGLYGLVSFILVQKTKEIGVRKVLGAPVSSLVILISKQFLKLVLISCILAWPVAYYLLKKWLNGYAYKIELNLWVFVFSGIMLMLITFLTIFYQALKVANTNPVEVLKYE